jgi:hypothetical protein
LIDALQGACEEALARVRGAVDSRAGLALTSDAEEPCHAAVRALLEWAQERPREARTLFWDTLAGDPKERALRDKLLHEAAELVENAWEQLGEAQRLGGPDVPALAILAGLFGLLSLARAAREPAADVERAGAHARSLDRLIQRAGQAPTLARALP